MAFVLDASVTMRWLTKDGSAVDLVYANYILDQFLDPTMSVHVPSHWPLEITNVMLRSERLGIIDKTASENFLSTLQLAPVLIDLATAETLLRIRSLWREITASPLMTPPISSSLCAFLRRLPHSIRIYGVRQNAQGCFSHKKG